MSWRSEARNSRRVVAALKALGRRVRALRARVGLTQQEAAEKAGLSVQHWSDLECGRSNPTVATLIGMARALGVELNAFFDER